MISQLFRSVVDYSDKEFHCVMNAPAVYITVRTPAKMKELYDNKYLILPVKRRPVKVGDRIEIHCIVEAYEGKITAVTKLGDQWAIKWKWL